MQVFALDASRSFGECVAACLGQSLAAHEERGFEDGEHKSRPLDPVAAAAGRSALQARGARSITSAELLGD